MKTFTIALVCAVVLLKDIQGQAPVQPGVPGVIDPAMTNRLATNPVPKLSPGLTNRFGTNRPGTNFFRRTVPMDTNVVRSPLTNVPRLNPIPPGTPPFDPSKIPAA